MDIAVNLVEAYLNVNGYLTMTEFEVQRRLPDGSYETATDVDIVAVRFPGRIYQGDPHRPDECELLLVEDPVLELSEGLVDVILGEVKEGKAEFNPGLKRHEVLHSVLRRIEWLYPDGLAEVLGGIADQGLSEVATHGEATVRTRLVAFGKSRESDLHTVSIGHIVETMVDYLHRFETVLRPATYKDPAPALLNLLVKVGFDISR